MGDTVSKLIERNIVTLEIDGLEFKCYRVNAGLCIEAFGVGVLGIVGATANEIESVYRKNLNKQFSENSAEAMQKILRVAMISPRLGDSDGVATDSVTWRTLGDFGPKLFKALMDETNEAVRDFPGSSEVQTE